MNGVYYILDTYAIIVSEQFFNQHVISNWHLLPVFLEESSLSDEVIDYSLVWVSEGNIVLDDQKLRQSFSIGM